MTSYTCPWYLMLSGSRDSWFEIQNGWDGRGVWGNAAGKFIIYFYLFTMYKSGLILIFSKRNIIYYCVHIYFVKFYYYALYRKLWRKCVSVLRSPAQHLKAQISTSRTEWKNLSPLIIKKNKREVQYTVVVFYIRFYLL